MAKSASKGGDAELLHSKDDFKRIDDLFKVQVGFFTLLGQISPKVYNWLPSSLSGLGWTLARLYSTFMISQTFHIALLFMKTTIDALADGTLEEITDATTSTIIYSFACFATCYWLWRSKPLEEFLARINRNYQHHSLPGLTYVSSWNSHRVARKFAISWFASCMSGVTLWALAPLMLNLRILPLKCWYPFDPLQPFVYEFIYLLQLISQLNMGCTFANGGVLFVSCAIIMLGQFDVLYCSLKNLNNYARLLSENDINVLSERQRTLLMGQDDELNQYIFGVEHKIDSTIMQQINNNDRTQQHSMHQMLRAGLIKCVKHHQFIMESCDKLEELFNPYCLVKSIQITLQLCLLVFVGVQGERSAIRMLNFVQYVGLTLVELILFTYCGELLRTHSVRSGEAFWRSEWWLSSSAIRKDVMIFLVNSKRAVRLTAGKFYLMDVQRLRSVVTQAFSFLTLLQKLADKNDK